METTCARKICGRCKQPKKLDNFHKSTKKTVIRAIAKNVLNFIKKNIGKNILLKLKNRKKNTIQNIIKSALNFWKSIGYIIKSTAKNIGKNTQKFIKKPTENINLDNTDYLSAIMTIWLPNKMENVPYAIKFLKQEFCK